MTFVLVAANSDQIIQASDRRLTSEGRLVDESANKVGHAICDDAAFLFGFTGIARAGNHVTSLWLLTALQDATQRGNDYRTIWSGLVEKADAYFRDSKTLRALPAKDRRLTIMLSGYSADGHIIGGLLSNFQDFERFIDHPEALDSFTLRTERSISSVNENPTMIQAIGQFGALTATDEGILRNMLIRRCPSEGIRQKMIALIQEISDRSTSGGTVGKNINTTRLRFAEPALPISGFATAESGSDFYLVDQVNLRTGAPKVAIAGAFLHSNTLLVFPKVHRNAPCPCGSGKKYRLCHGRLR